MVVERKRGTVRVMDRGRISYLFQDKKETPPTPEFSSGVCRVRLPPWRPPGGAGVADDVTDRYLTKETEPALLPLWSGQKNTALSE
jgi:hypothetical protein